MFYFVPIERLPERYTDQMYVWVVNSLAKRGVPYEIILGDVRDVATKGDQFLNWTSTIAYKASQIRKIADLFASGTIQDGDVFFVGDIWFPGIEAIAYMRDAMQLDVKVYGINYAGPFDPTDLVHPMLYWGRYQEAAWYEICDKVFVGSQFHKDLIYRGLLKIGALHLVEKIYPTGLVWDQQDVIDMVKDERMPDMDRTIMWPHRISPDKNIEQLYEIARRFPDVRFLITSSRQGQKFTPDVDNVEFQVLNKRDYYVSLASCAALLSTAFHENFGYTIREATALQTPIICPRRADYPEMIITKENLFFDTDEACLAVERALRKELPVAKLKYFGGFETMLNHMGF